SSDRDVLGHIDQDRAGTTGACNIEGALQGLCQILHILDQEVVLDARAGDADGVAFLEGVFADGRGRNLATDDDHGDRVHVGRRNAGYCIGCAGPTGYQRDAGFLRGSGISICRMDCSLLVTNQDVLKAILLVDFVVDVQHGAARVAKDMFHAFVSQTAHEDFGAIEFHCDSFQTGAIHPGRRRCIERQDRIRTEIHITYSVSRFTEPLDPHAMQPRTYSPEWTLEVETKALAHACGMAKSKVYSGACSGQRVAGAVTGCANTRIMDRHKP